MPSKKDLGWLTRLNNSLGSLTMIWTHCLVHSLPEYLLFSAARPPLCRVQKNDILVHWSLCCFLRLCFFLSPMQQQPVIHTLHLRCIKMYLITLKTLSSLLVQFILVQSPTLTQMLHMLTCFKLTNSCCGKMTFVRNTYFVFVTTHNKIITMIFYSVPPMHTNILKHMRKTLWQVYNDNIWKWIKIKGVPLLSKIQWEIHISAKGRQKQATFS